MTAYGLDGWFDGGGFCEDGYDRALIGSCAIDRARLVCGEVPMERTYVIGDTPLDIKCAHALGARAIAVASGEYDVDALRVHDPWWVIDSLPPADELLARLDL